MSYATHNYNPGDVLFAENLNEMDVQIAHDANVLEQITEEPVNLWTIGDLTFVKTSGKVNLGIDLENGATYTFFANVDTTDTYNNDCRVYIAQQNGNASSRSFLIEKGTERIVTFTVPDVDVVFDGFIFYAARKSSEAEGDTATFSNIRLVKGNYPDAYPAPSAIDRVMREHMTYGEQTKWLALGDSITLGVYSFANGSTAAEAVGVGWVQRLAYYLGYDLTTYASRGMGYTAAVTGKDPESAQGPRINLDTLLTRVEAFEEDFNLITLAFGVNDYNTPSEATLATVATGLNDAIARLAARWPRARIVVITPFNCCNNDGCTAATKWNCNYERGDPGRSLADIAHKIEECCDAAGVECINCTENFVLNVYNISKDLTDEVRLLPDKIHPSLEAHALIAKAMVHHLLF